VAGKKYQRQQKTAAAENSGRFCTENRAKGAEKWLEKFLKKKDSVLHLNTL
jgi:hypothetical protein